MDEITEKTNLLDYPILIINFMKKYQGKGVPMDAEHCNEIWNSLTEEEKESNKDYSVVWNCADRVAFITQNGHLVMAVKMA